MLKTDNLSKYLERYAEPEAARLGFTTELYEWAFVVPSCGEGRSLLEGWRTWAACLAPHQRVLFVLVVNSGGDTRDVYCRANEELLTELHRLEQHRWDGKPCLFAVREQGFDVLVVDRHHEPYRLPPKTGVGLARKIGADLVCAYYHRGNLKSPWWMSTDADVKLPKDLPRTWSQLPLRPGIACLPFAHVSGGDDAVDGATLAVEVELRYHELGLVFAGSTYAWPALGSCLSVHAELYVAVRGFPKRMAGEDFYLLQKGSKVGPITRCGGQPIEISARLSERTPFGTGASVRELLGRAERLARRSATGVEQVFTLRNPKCYVELRQFLDHVRRAIAERDVGVWLGWFSGAQCRCPNAAQLVVRWRLHERMNAWCSATASSTTRRQWAEEWLDGLRQVQFLKAAEQEFADLPYRVALQEAPFARRASGGLGISEVVAAMRDESYRPSS